MRGEVSPITQEYALAYIGATGLTSGLHWRSHGGLFPTAYRLAEGDEHRRTHGIYVLTAEGQQLAERSALWQAHQHLVAEGFQLHTGRRQKPGHLSYRHHDGRTAWTSRHGRVYVGSQLVAQFRRKAAK